MTTPNIGSPTTASVRLLLYGGLTFPCMLLQILALLFGWRLMSTLPVWYHRRCCKILGIRVERRGRQSRKHPTLYVCNHVSYFDITVLGSLIEGSFVAKSEVANWPLFGWLARLQRSVFVERQARRAAKDRNEMTRRLEAGDHLILFPEGTSGDGNWVLPFKSALFAVAEYRPHHEPLAVQPVSITYTKLDGVPMGRYLRPLFAWYGDMELARHLWQAVGMGILTVVIEFHPVVEFDEFGTRKALSAHCHDRIAAGVAAALSGRRRRVLQGAAAGAA
jgi:1-acyl-sn-glycerol-3-phosphate acyltransferase